MQLWNQLSKEELVVKLTESGYKFVTVSFYKYFSIANTQLFRDHLFQMWTNLDIVGRTYIAEEGINAQISIPISHFDKFRNELNEIDFLNEVRLNIAVDESETEHPFLKLKIKIRNKIVADGLVDSEFDPSDTGKHLKVEEFNHLIDDPETILIDMRNHYESEVGHFEGALTPDVDTFRESLSIIEDEILKGNEDKNIVMYCTGGIRCEKASAWYKHRGFKNVHQLEGGIIKYAHDVKELGVENKFIGKNFVFDERRGERITDDVIAKCHQCGDACDTHTNCVNDSCHLLFIQCEKCKEKLQNTCCTECYETIQLPEEVQKELRKGLENSNKIFKKGRSTRLKFKENNVKPLSFTSETLK